MSKFSEDIARYRSMGHSGKQLWFSPAVWAVAIYRFGHWLYVENPPYLLRIPYKIIHLFAYMFSEVVMEMCLDPQATIGGGLYIAHIGGVHINPQAIIGSNCDIAHRVTIGASAMGRGGAPVLGDRVYIGTGATLVGKIKVGSGAKIAANTLVMSNIPEGATVMGVPGRIIMRAPVSPSPELSAAEMTDAE
ncbi:serine O-acetyltransferase [Granulicella sp. S190]|jgi:serine O-acetyltransferase|uniref:serine O-acetyltransferase n=1 Tax=Granulicella sp. S190 TaxID=1747226 RepID=UPI00131DC68B|nr:serine acetyltransferase [Granulicella sp. S190]